MHISQLGFISFWLSVVNGGMPCDTAFEGDCGEHADTRTSEIEERQLECGGNPVEKVAVIEGEAWRFMHRYVEGNTSFPHEEFTWYRNDSRDHYISSSEEERIHQRGAELFIFNLTLNDSGLYIARWETPPGTYHDICTSLTVFPANNPWDPCLLYYNIRNADHNPRIPCPEPIVPLCNDMKGELTWFKNVTLLPGEHKNYLRLSRVTKEDDGIYTCLCTWRHNNHTYKTTASMWFHAEKISTHLQPEIIMPTAHFQTADQGSSAMLRCSVLCGKNAEGYCSVIWRMNEQEINKEGYIMNCSTDTDIKSEITTMTAVLTIEKVSTEDFDAIFKCVVSSTYPGQEFELTLQYRGQLEDA